MHIDVICSTRNRVDKLERMLKSIPGQTFRGHKIYKTVIADGCEITRKWSGNNDLIDNFIFQPEWKGQTFCRNLAISKTKSYVIYATDDIEFMPGSIQRAFGHHIENFSTGDGVVGFIQDGNKKFHETGIALLGPAFIDRYPGRQPFFQGYFHFAAQEIYWLAAKYSIFEQCKKAIVYHHNPFLEKTEMDKTHIDARKYKKQDHELMEKRQALGLIWGDK